MLVLAQQFVEFPWNNSLTNALNNALHILLFTGITVLIRWSLPSLSLFRVFALTLALALVTEAAQWITGGSPSVEDVVRDLLGVLLAFPVWSVWTSLRVAIALMASAAVTLIHPGVIFASNLAKAERFPLLYDSTVWDRSLISESNSEITIKDNNQTHIVWADTRWPGFHLTETVEDWSRYDYIVAEVMNPGDPQTLTIAVRHKGRRGTSAFQPNNLERGENFVRVELDQLVTKANSEESPIVHVILHTHREYAGHEIYLKRVYLE